MKWNMLRERVMKRIDDHHAFTVISLFGIIQ